MMYIGKRTEMLLEMIDDAWTDIQAEDELSMELVELHMGVIYDMARLLNYNSQKISGGTVEFIDTINELRGNLREEKERNAVLEKEKDEIKSAIGAYEEELEYQEKLKAQLKKVAFGYQDECRKQNDRIKRLEEEIQSYRNKNRNLEKQIRKLKGWK